MQSIELLAPAKNLEVGMAAIQCGADAVYIGAERFGAREAAGNPLKDIEALVVHAHQYWAKVYVTLNTLLRDDELPDAVRLVHALYRIGIDGLIIQDSGLLECALPPVPLIASTQMHNDTPEKAAFLEKVGFKRVILARELSLDEIASIRKKTAMELEAFVHGALCVCYSGQCTMSYAIGGRSGNRGACAQPCRRPYTLADASGRILAENQHLLSLKDLNRSASLRDLIQVGITSFKIEGRLKDKAYVMNVVAHYRRALDEVLAADGLKRSASGKVRAGFIPNPDKTFNRGYTEYFLRGRTGDMASMGTPKSTGERIGRVASVRKNAFTLDASAPLHPGDGICFFDGGGSLVGTRVDRVENDTVFPRGIKGMRPGAEVFRNLDVVFARTLHAAKTERKIDVSFTLDETPEGFRLEAVDEDGNRADTGLECEKRTAGKGDDELATWRKQLARTGGTAFECTGLEIHLEKPRFIPVSGLNALRRDVLAALASMRETNRPRPGGTKIVPNDTPYPEKKLTYRGNVLNRKAGAFYRRHGVVEIEPAAESGLDMRGRTLMTTRYCVLYELGRCPKGRALPAPCFLVDEDGRRFDLRFDCKECKMEIILTK